MISDTQFHAILELKVADCITILIKELSKPELDVSREFYNSECYRALENSKTDMWHYSPRCISNLFLEEKKTGSFEWPEEV